MSLESITEGMSIHVRSYYHRYRLGKARFPVARGAQGRVGCVSQEAVAPAIRAFHGGASGVRGGGGGCPERPSLGTGTYRTRAPGTAGRTTLRQAFPEAAKERRSRRGGGRRRGVVTDQAFCGREVRIPEGGGSGLSDPDPKLTKSAGMARPLR